MMKKHWTQCWRLKFLETSKMTIAKNWILLNFKMRRNPAKKHQNLKEKYHLIYLRIKSINLSLMRIEKIHFLETQEKFKERLRWRKWINWQKTQERSKDLIIREIWNFILITRNSTESNKMLIISNILLLVWTLL